MGYEFIERVDMSAEDENGVIEHWHRYLSVQEICRGKCVLDAACGTGYGSDLLAKCAEHVYGLDISLQTVESAKTHFKRFNLEYLHGSIAKIPLPDASVDVVVSFETIEHVHAEVQRAFLKEVKRVLRPFGCLVVSTPCREKSLATEMKNRFHVCELTLTDFRRLLEGCFGHVDVYEQRVAVSSIISGSKKRGEYHSIVRADSRWMPAIESTPKVLPDYYVAVCCDMEISALGFGVAADESNLLLKKIYDSAAREGYALAENTLGGALTKVEQDYRKLSQLKDETVRTLGEEQSARARLVADYGKLEGQLKDAQTALAMERGAREALVADYGKLEGQLKDAQTALATERGAREALAADYGKLEKLFTESKIEVARLNKACDEWAYGKQQSDLSCADLKRQLAELKSSPSWRLTAPLRSMKRKLRQVVSRIEAFTSQIALRVRLRRLTRSLRGCEIVFDHNLGGGANDYRKNYIRDKVSSGVPCVLVHNNLWYYENRDFSVWVFVPECVEGTEWKFATWRKCRRFLADLDVSRIVYNNLVYNPETAEIVKWIGRQRAKLLLMIHDFYPVCQYYLMTKNGRYCEGKGCDSCAKDQGDSRHLFGRIRTAAEWKSLWAPLFERAEEIRVFSPFAIEVLESFHPGVRDRVICLPHSMDYFKGAPVELDGGAGPRIGVVGSIYSVAKGSAVVAELAESLPGDEKLVVIGTYAGVPHDRIVVTGRYEPKDIPKLLREHGINIVLFPSVCPETFSYTVSELMLLRVPVLAFDVGAQGCKIREYDRGKIVAEQDPRSILAAADELYHRVYGGKK